MAKINSEKLKNDFPIFKRKINGKRLVYLDSAATSQKTKSVIDAISNFYKNNNANINRGIHTLGDEATRMYEDSRSKVSSFINCSPKEIVFTRNATESINLVARSFVRSLLKKDDVILLTEMEHHANLLPWMVIAKEVGAKIKYIPFTNEGVLDLNKAKLLLSSKPKFFSFTHVSNVLGTVNPVKKLVELAHKCGVPVLVDASQSVPHMKIDVKDLGCDFLVFSSHKMLGPTGVGVLFGKRELLSSMRVFLTGGDMVKEAYFDHFIPEDVPTKFEAGTPDIASVVSFSKAIDYINSIGIDHIEKYDRELTRYAFVKLSKIKGVVIYGPKDFSLRSSLVSFNIYVDGNVLIHPHDLSTLLDMDGIAIRAGHHCCMPLHIKLNIPASSRASFYFYNSKKDVDVFINSVNKIIKMFSKMPKVVKNE